MIHIVLLIGTYDPGHAFSVFCHHTTVVRLSQAQYIGFSLSTHSEI